ncbi:hypothetical protein ACQPZP_39845 [Spirillospora sp. CA-142024]|uniref:hypothetical protein n=1 Tax=Spirillospora sp. CA-142024 TaxID=3240036 RepID=UPI003D8C92BC
MAAQDKLRGHLSADMQDEETINVVVVAQLKRGMKQHLGKNLAAGLATGLVTTAATGGAGLFVFASMPAVWVVVTSQRVLMYAKTSSASKPGKLVFEAPRKALTARMKSRLLTQVVIADRGDGQSLARLNLGVRRKAANSIVVSVEH